MRVGALHFDRNHLTGTIPTEVGEMGRSLGEYGTGMYFCCLRCGVTHIFYMTNVENMTLFDNQLSGTIPSEVGLLTNLGTLPSLCIFSYLMRLFLTRMNLQTCLECTETT